MVIGPVLWEHDYSVCSVVLQPEELEKNVFSTGQHEVQKNKHSWGKLSHCTHFGISDLCMVLTCRYSCLNFMINFAYKLCSYAWYCAIQVGGEREWERAMMCRCFSFIYRHLKPRQLLFTVSFLPFPCLYTHVTNACCIRDQSCQSYYVTMHQLENVQTHISDVNKQHALTVYSIKIICTCTVNVKATINIQY